MTSFLQVFSSKRMFLLLLLGFSSGLPLALTGGTLNAWMASEQIDLKTIGLFSLISIPYSLKFVWAPVLDRFSLTSIGRRRSWMLLSQIGLILSIIAMGHADPKSSLAILGVLALLVAFFSATQDIAIDAFRPESLNTEEYGAGAATAILGYRLAMLTSGSLALILSDHYSWKMIYWLMAGFVGIGLFATLWADEPQLNVKPPRTLREAAVEPIREFFQRSGLRYSLEIFLFILIYKLDGALMTPMTTPFLMNLGFTKTDIGLVNKGFGLVSTIVGALAGGAILSKIGLFRALILFGICQTLTNLLFAALALTGKNATLMVTAIGVDNLFGGMGTAAYTAFLMSLCNKRFTAFQYAALSSIMALTGKFAGAPSGLFAESFGWTSFFLITALGGLPGILLVWRRFNRWKVVG